MADTDDDNGSYATDDEKILSDAKEAFTIAVEAESENRDQALADLRFARLGQQWPSYIVKQRQEEGRPMLTVNKLPAYIRQVVNDARQNKPSISVRPVDSRGDVETAQVISGIVRHIEYNSSADVAYDTAIECAVSSGWGYWRIGMEYAHNDTFEMDLTIDRIADQFTVYGDPWATSADGSDWMSAFVVERMSKDKFKQRYPDAEVSNWEGEVDANWIGEDWVQVAEWWVREEIEREIIELSDGTVVDVERLNDEDFIEELMMSGATPVEGRSRKVPGYKVKQCILTDNEVLSKRDWPGKYIPIVPVYGDEVNEEGKRHFRSLIHDAIDPQRQFNYWRTAATELLALAPRVPYIGPKKAFTADPEAWATANTRSHSYLPYEGQQPPQRQPMDSSAVGAITQAMNAADDIKSVTGLYDASLGARSNETSGRAIMARQREGDTSTFHFIDNLTRSIRQSGRILIDLIPHVWSDERIVRLMGEDGTVTEQKVNGPVPVMDKNGRPEMEPDPAQLPIPGAPPPMRPKTRIFSLTQGKYDLTATAGPSYTTKRQESAEQMMELIRVMPQAAPLISDLLVKNLDWPGADEIADRLKAMLPAQVEGEGIPPELQEAMKQMEQALKQLQSENEQLKADRQADAAKIAVDAKKADIDAYSAETKRLETLGKIGMDAASLNGSFAQPMSILEPRQPQRPQSQQMRPQMPGMPPRPNGGMRP